MGLKEFGDKLVEANSDEGGQDKGPAMPKGVLSKLVQGGGPSTTPAAGVGDTAAGAGMAKGGIVMSLPPGAKFCPNCGKPIKGKKNGSV